MPKFIPVPIPQNEEDTHKLISGLQAEIDEVDDQLINLLRKRSNLSRSIGVLKRSLGIRSYSPERETEIFRRVAALSVDESEQSCFLRIFERILDEARILHLHDKVHQNDQKSGQ